MSNWYECQKCFKPCDVVRRMARTPFPNTVHESKCCNADVKVRSA